ncbi:MAG: DUF4365 domain-containing protein [Bacteroidota bacterium]
MKRHKSHLIKEEAERIFNSSIPTSWVSRKEDPDYGIDFNIETAVNDNSGNILTGKRFYVQLKGVNKPIIKGNYLSFSVEVRHLNYYYDSCLLPVFLVVIDINLKNSYWLFIQEYIYKNSLKDKWNNQKTFTVHLPISNNSLNNDLFINSIDAAFEFMHRLHPLSLKKTIQFERDKWETLDPRFSISLNASENKINYILSAKETVPVQFIFKADQENVITKAKNLFEKGLPTSFDPDQIDVSGSLLIKSIFSKGGTFQFARKAKVPVTLIAVNEAGIEIAKMDLPYGSMEGGTKETRINASSINKDLNISLIISQLDDEHCKIVCNFNIYISKWNNKPILDILSFDDIYSLFKELCSGARFKVRTMLNNNIWYPVSDSGGQYSESFKYLSILLNTVHNIRQIASKYNLNPLMPTLSEDIIEDVDFLHWILFDRESRTCSSAHITTQLAKDHKLNLETMITDVHVLDLKREPDTFPFLNESILLNHIIFHFSHMKIATDLHEIELQMNDNNQDYIELKWESTDKSKMNVEYID